MANTKVKKSMQTQIEIEIPFYDLDPMQVVWHGNYVKYLERGRCALLDKLGMTYSDMAAAGLAFPIVKLNVKYIRPCVFGQKILVQTTLLPSENFLIFNYKIMDASTNTVLCKAETKQMAVEIATQNTLYVIPQPFLGIIQEAA